MTQPIIASEADQHLQFYDSVKDKPFHVDSGVLSQISEQALTPERRTRLYGWTYDAGLSNRDIAVYRQGRNFVLGINDRHKPGSISVNLSENPHVAGQGVRMIEETIRRRTPGARILTTGATVGANAINSDHDRMTVDAVRQSGRWAKNR